MGKIDIKQKLDELSAAKYREGFQDIDSVEEDRQSAIATSIKSEILAYVTNLERERDELKEKMSSPNDDIHSELLRLANDSMHCGESHIDYDEFVPDCKEQFIVLRNPSYKAP